jgi:hypothetical protein
MNYTTYSTWSFVLHRTQLWVVGALLLMAFIASLIVAATYPVVGAFLACFFVMVALLGFRHAERMKWELIERTMHNFTSQVIHNRFDLNQTQFEAARRAILAGPIVYETGKWTMNGTAIQYQP